MSFECSSLAKSRSKSRDSVTSLTLFLSFSCSSMAVSLQSNVFRYNTCKEIYILSTKCERASCERCEHGLWRVYFHFFKRSHACAAQAWSTSPTGPLVAGYWLLWLKVLLGGSIFGGTEYLSRVSNGKVLFKKRSSFLVQLLIPVK